MGIRSALLVQDVSNVDRSLLCAFCLVPPKLYSAAQEEEFVLWQLSLKMWCLGVQGFDVYSSLTDKIVLGCRVSSALTARMFCPVGFTGGFEWLQSGQTSWMLLGCPVLWTRCIALTGKKWVLTYELHYWSPGSALFYTCLYLVKLMWKWAVEVFIVLIKKPDGLG